jgi:hypothetical protein
MHFVIMICNGQVATNNWNRKDILLMKNEANMDVTIVTQVIVLAIYIHYQQGK